MKIKRVISLILCVLILMSVLSVRVFAADVDMAQSGNGEFYEIESYDELKICAAAVGGIEDFKLTSDIYVKDNKNNNEIVLAPGKKMYLDLNGYSICRETQGNDVALFRVRSDASLVVFDTSNAKTGSCTFSEGYSSYNKSVFSNEGGYLKIDNGYYEVLSPYEQGECSVIRTTSGTTEIYGGTFDSSAGTGGDTISVGHDAYLYEPPLVLIRGGDFYGKYQNVDITTHGNYLGQGCLFPNVYVMGGNFYVCNKGTDKIIPGFCYCNNGWGRVIIAEGTVFATSLNMSDHRYLTASTKKLFSQTIDGFTGGYYEVTAPPMIMPSGEDKYGEFYFDRLALLCTKELPRSYNEETNIMYKEVFDNIKNAFDTIYVDENEAEAPEIKLINRTADIKYINWYVCDESNYNGKSTTWTYLGNYDNVVQWQPDERPKEACDLLVRCVVTKSDATSYEDIVRISYDAYKDPKTIESVELEGLSVPDAGKNPDFEITPMGDGYYINRVYWADITQSSASTMKETDTFEAGHKYKLEVWLRAEDGYKFRTDSDDCIDITAEIDGNEAQSLSVPSDVAATITMEFKIPESRVISEVDVVGVDKPLEGETPDTEAFCVTRGCVVTGLKWYDITGGGYVLMGEKDTFEAGHIYRVNVMVETEGGYTFLMVDRYNEAWGYINGVKAIAGAADEDNWLQLGYIFPACEENPNKPAVLGILGDANLDDKVNVKDATLIQKYAALLEELDSTQLILADVNCDGAVNVKDATAIQKYAAMIDTGFDIGKTVTTSR